MTRTLHIEALDHHVDVRAAEPLAQLLEGCLAGLASEGSERADEIIELLPAGANLWQMRAEPDVSVSRRSERARLLAGLLEHMNLRAASSVPEAIPFHAAAVAAPDGRVVLLAGASGSGKSTLGAAAVLGGWRLVAEEVAAVEPVSYAVRPYHRPIGLRSGGAAALGIVPPPDPWFGEVYPWCPPRDTLSDGGKVAAIAVVTRDAPFDAPSRLAPASALAELIRHVVVPDDDRVAAAFHRMASLARVIPVYRLSYDAPSDGMTALNHLLAP